MQAKEQKIARREFLASIGKAVGGSAMLRTMAALEMTKLGYSCTLLEAQAAAGGRNKTIRSGRIVYEIDNVVTLC